jgi:hypothetical protein
MSFSENRFYLRWKGQFADSFLLYKMSFWASNICFEPGENVNTKEFIVFQWASEIIDSQNLDIKQKVKITNLIFCCLSCSERKVSHSSKHLNISFWWRISTFGKFVQKRTKICEKTKCRSKEVTDILATECFSTQTVTERVNEGSCGVNTTFGRLKRCKKKPLKKGPF